MMFVCPEQHWGSITQHVDPPSQTEELTLQTLCIHPNMERERDRERNIYKITRETEKKETRKEKPYNKVKRIGIRLLSFVRICVCVCIISKYAVLQPKRMVWQMVNNAKRLG